MNKLLIVTMCLASVGYVSAQETMSASADVAGAEVAQLPDKPDEGPAAVVEAEQSAPAPAEKKFKNARKVLQDIAKSKGWREKWDQKKGRIIQIGVGEFKTKDPANDKDFYVQREMATKSAVLEAKARIIQMINQEMSAEDTISMPGTDVNKELGAERERIQKLIDEQRKQLADLLEKTDKAEADVLRGTTFGQRLNDLMAAAIKKLDAEYDADKHDKAAKARYEALKAQMNSAEKNYNDLMERAQKLQKSVKRTQKSTVATFASMPLFGATAIMQTESWNDKTGMYQVAVLFCWSMQMERAARAIATGQDFKSKEGPKSVEDWLDDQNLATMIGPRQYVDNEGNRWFLGVTARKYTEEMSPTDRESAEGEADMFAQQMAVFCVYADVEARKTAVAKMVTRGEKGGDDVNQVATSFAKDLSQKFEKKTIRGLQRLAGEEVEHPVTGESMYVCVYGLNANDAKEALKIETINVATKVESNRHQAVERGRKIANAAAIKASENRAEDIQKGVQQQNAAIGTELQGRQTKKATGGVSIINQGSTEAPTKVKKSTSGAFSGDTNVGDDF